MNFSIKPTQVDKIETDVLVVFCFEEGIKELSDLDQKMAGLLMISAQKENFTGRNSEKLLISSKEALCAYKLLVIGMGKKEEVDLNSLRKILAETTGFLRTMKIKNIAVVVDDHLSHKYPPNEVVKTMTEAIMLSSYHFLKYKGEKEKNDYSVLEEVIFQIKPGQISQANNGIDDGKIDAEAAFFTRDLVNEPASVTTPTHLANVALKIAKESKNRIKTRIFGTEELEKLGMEAYLGVSQGSIEPPKFIRLEYKPTRFNKKIVIVGKGITFDTGGLSLKSSEHMESMKSDMSGAAVVLGVFQALKYFDIPYQVVGLIPACENMPSGKALHPGDILRAANGKTIEVLNTDAEGRLTLADAFSFATKYEKPDYLIDIATLTGACRIALGEDIAGLWGNNQFLIDKLREASKNSGEMVWQMPLPKEYNELLKSHIADLRNIQIGKYGGAITAAIFLSEFVDETSWAHLDIAGPSYAEKPSPLIPVGGSGFGVRMLLRFLKDL